MMAQLQDQVTLWRNKYEALAKLYSQLRNEHLEMLGKYKSMQLKANSAQEAIDRMERMERDVKTKNLELADMIRERDRARHDLDRIKAVRSRFRNHRTEQMLMRLLLSRAESERRSGTTQARPSIRRRTLRRRFSIKGIRSFECHEQVQSTDRRTRRFSPSKLSLSLRSDSVSLS